nr:hypothetical protein GCM10010200_057480 [Actinomadura rugatobispora]
MVRGRLLISAHATGGNREQHLTRLAEQLELRGFPAWVTTLYRTPLLRTIRIHPRRTLIIACVRARGGWVFVWPGGYAPGSDPVMAAERVTGFLMR